MKTIPAVFVSMIANSTGRGEVWESLPDSQKKQALHMAAVIVSYETKGIFDELEDPELDYAIAEQALHIADHFEAYSASDSISIFNSSSYSDGVISVAGRGTTRLCKAALVYINALQQKYNISFNEVWRG